MRIERLRDAVMIARAFAKRGGELLDEINGYDSNKGSGYINGSKLSGAVRRSSMELTRKLAELRKA